MGFWPVHPPGENKFNEITFQLVMALMSFDMNVSNFCGHFAKRNILHGNIGLSRTKFDHLSKTLQRACLNEKYIGYSQEGSQDPDPCERMQNMLQYAQDKCLTAGEFGLLWGIYGIFRNNIESDVQKQWEAYVQQLIAQGYPEAQARAYAMQFADRFK